MFFISSYRDVSNKQREELVWKLLLLGILGQYFSSCMHYIRAMMQNVTEMETKQRSCQDECLCCSTVYSLAKPRSIVLKGHIRVRLTSAVTLG